MKLFPRSYTASIFGARKTWRYSSRILEYHKYQSSQSCAYRKFCQIRTDENKDERTQKALKVSTLGLGVNCVLAAFKGIAGVLYHSPALLSDAVHSLSDLISDFVTLWAVKQSARPPDSNHPYGHGRFEAIGSLGISSLLLAAGGGVCANAYFAIEQISDHGQISAALLSNSWVPLTVVLAAVGAKEALYRVTLRVGKSTGNSVIIANAHHHRSDALSSIVAMFGIAAAHPSLGLHLQMLDPIAGIIVGCMICRTGVMVGRGSLMELTDAMDRSTLQRIGDVIAQVDGVCGYDTLRARRMGGPQGLLVDVRIRVDKHLTVSSGHQIAENVRRAVICASAKDPDEETISEVLVNVMSEKHVHYTNRSADAGDADDGLLSVSRPSAQIEQDIRQTIRDKAQSSITVVNVTHVDVHFFQGKVLCNVTLALGNDAISVRQASALSRRTRQICLDSVPDVHEVDVHLELQDQ